MIETKMDFQSDTPEGVCFVVHGVPTRIRYSPEGQEFRTFSLAVCLQLDKLIKNVLTLELLRQAENIEFDVVYYSSYKFKILEQRMIKRFLIYGFPFFLLTIETILREALSLGTNTSLGPSLAATGVGFLISLIVPKHRNLQLSSTTEQELKSRGITVISTRERHFIDLVWLFIFLLTTSWTYVVYLSYKNPTLPLFGLPMLIVIGFLNYFIGVLFSEIREVI